MDLIPHITRTGYDVSTLVAARKLLFVGAISVCTAVLGLLLWFKAEMFNNVGPHPSNWAGYDALNFIGLFSFGVFSTLGVSLLHVGTSTLACIHGGILGLILMGMLGLVFVVLGGLGAVWGSETMQCLAVFCTGSTASTNRGGRPEAGVAFRSGLGLAAFLSFVPIGVVILFQAARRVFGVDPFWTGHKGRRFVSDRFAPLLRFLFAVAFVSFWAVVSLYMPNSLESFLPVRIARNARMLSSHNYTLCRTEPHTYTCPDLPWSWIRTRNLVMNDEVVLKVYPSNLIFYGYLFVILLTTALIRSFRYGRRFLKRRCPVLRDYTYGEVGFLFLTFSMIVLFFLYWIQGHNFKQRYTDVSNDTVSSERWYRSMGQLAVAFLSLSIFPVSRYSVLYSILGTSWESSIWVHRLLGYGVFLGIVGHAIGWYVRCFELGAFPQGIFSIPAVDPPGNRDDYTIPLITLTTLFSLVSTIIFALEPLRRRFYELFYYTHIVTFYMLVPVVLWHAASAWEYFLPGLTIWFLDWLLRIYRRGLTVDLVSAAASGSFVEIRFRHGSLGALPGQFVFVNVPDISLLQWHPFSIMCEHEGYYLLYIKSMGEGTWTEKLGKLVCRRGLKFKLNVEGPCGRALDINEHQNILFVAGGIGITPCASVYSHICDRMALGLRSPTPMLLWSVRDRELLLLMSQLWQGGDSSAVSASSTIEEAPSDRVQVFFTGGCNVEDGEYTCVVNERMDISDRIPQVIAGKDPRTVLLFVCGPPGLVELARSVAHSLGVDFHQETFLL
ncbi:ferric reductase transmembrane protein [Trypanosoma brucei equiperdum]|uniref:Ferric reductase transmembrane protein n=1 Tax=Trypanosoma brucei equiperdum TaxID=630700 RepID=A0A3L6KSY0_9TRYP|nr:ferric reductase transmembrane protein [Trypanosoma brucei equiperdum]